MSSVFIKSKRNPEVLKYYLVSWLLGVNVNNKHIKTLIGWVPSIHLHFVSFVTPLGYYTPRNEVVGGYTGFTMSVCLSVDESYVV